MNRYPRAILFIAYFIGTAFAGNEANTRIERAPLPEAPLLRRAPDLSKWTVTYTYPGREKKEETGANSPSVLQPVRLLTLVVSKSRNTYFEQKSYSNGTSGESCRIGDMQIHVSGSSREVQVYEPASFASDSSGQLMVDSSVYPDYSRTDFPGLEWVSADTFIGVQKRQGRDCLVFQENPLPGARNGTRPTALLIDQQTRLPVLLESPEVKALYSFEPLSEPRALSSEVQSYLDKRTEVIKTMTTASPSY